MDNLIFGLVFIWGKNQKPIPENWKEKHNKYDYYEERFDVKPPPPLG